MILENLIRFIAELIEQKFTGQIRLNFFEGNLASKIDKRESIEVK